jgi:hypothetical protein
VDAAFVLLVEAGCATLVLGAGGVMTVLLRCGGENQRCGA